MRIIDKTYSFKGNCYLLKFYKSIFILRSWSQTLVKTPKLTPNSVPTPCSYFTPSPAANDNLLQARTYTLWCGPIETHSRLYLSAFQTLQIGHFSFTLSTRFLSSQLLFKQSQRYCCSVLLLCCFLFFEMGTYTYIWITGWTSACKLFDEMTETNLTAFESIQMHYHWAF